MTNTRIKVGTIISTHGLGGAVKVFAEIGGFESLVTSEKVFFDSKDIFRVTSCKTTKNPNVYIVHIGDIADIDAAQGLVHRSLFAHKSDLASAGEILVMDLVGLEVFYKKEDSSVKLGSVCSIVNYGQGPMLEIKSEAGKKLANVYPASFDFIETIDVDANYLVLKPGLFVAEEELAIEEKKQNKHRAGHKEHRPHTGHIANANSNKHGNKHPAGRGKDGEHLDKKHRANLHDNHHKEHHETSQGRSQH